ncbi:RHS repeat-associated core domain-containing protein [Capnocytophaga canis]|uniref:RHS repeat-associated core domain-containing protein n=1 Tax=Capnocytophaga canis TaxID=1848903 RepID=UPI0023EEDEB7|nr:RHS repeat-associated core domain-containing protein [Capnocytophaga canis]
MHEWKTFDYRETTDNDRITWVFQDFVPVAKLQGDKSYSIISDHIGTPLVAIDTNGVKVWERELDIYGRVRKEFTSDDVANRRSGFMPFLYQGQYYDKETELAYNRFRYYDPNTGNYISQDPIGLAGNNSTLYGYVTDTNTWIDIFGKR